MAELDAQRAEMLNNAARKIQRQVRTFLARRHLIAMRKAAVIIQKHWRGTFCFANRPACNWSHCGRSSRERSTLEKHLGRGFLTFYCSY